METKVLYVEDEVFLGKIVTESLESRGYHVHWVRDGKDIVDAFTTFAPDICVFDVMLPNVNGFRAGRQVREINAGVPILFLTAKDQTDDVLTGFKAGGNDYVKKPFSMEELIARIENLLQLTRNEREPMVDNVQFGAWTFSPLTMELKDGKNAHRLSHKESELLKILLRHQNLPVERKRILMDVWGDDSIFNSRTLDVYITRLRKYLKKHPGVKIITLKGVGYQFVVEGE